MADSIKNQKAPVLRRKPQSVNRHCMRICPYAVNSVDPRVPIAQKTVHTVTSGAMRFDLVNGHDGRIFVCDDPNCSFFLATATSGIDLELRNTVIVSGSYQVQVLSYMNMPCSGVKFSSY